MTDISPHLPTELNEQQSAAIYGGTQQPSESTPATSSPSPASEPPASEDGPDIATLIAEAEERGYLRGRNEAAEEMMGRPAMWQPVEPPASTGERLTAAADNFLSGLRPGVWSDL